MFGWLKRKSPQAADGDLTAAQPPGVFFPWPKGAVLTAVDELVLAVPVALFEPDRPMADFVFGPDGMEINIPANSDIFYIRLSPGMSVSLAKTVQSRVVADDNSPRRIRVTRSPSPPIAAPT
jgi:hypothetical protein